MEHTILQHQDDPAQLERLYRENKSGFRRAFTALYPQLKNNTLALYWNERLNFEKEEIAWGNSREFLFVLIASMVAGVIAKLPTLLPINAEFYYERNVGFIVFPLLAAFFAWKNKLSVVKTALMWGAFTASVLFINALPSVDASDTTILSCIHLIIVLWAVLSFAFVGDTANRPEKRLAFLKYNGDLVVMTGLILIAGAVLSAITVGLFSLLGLHIEQFYMENVGVFGAAAAPLAATYLVENNPHLVGKVSPVIARIFSPLVLLMLVTYLIAMMYLGKDPYNDRQFLLVFNGLLIGVMCLIFFSVAGTSQTTKTNTEVWILLLLSLVTLIVNGVALSAIFFRISEWGITPNRMAVVGGNVLILLHLLLVSRQLVKVITKQSDISSVSGVITSYLPVYFGWAAFVSFIFPFLFGFK